MSFRGYIGRIKNNITGKRFRISGTEPYEGILSLHRPSAIELLTSNIRWEPGYPPTVKTIEAYLRNLRQLPGLEITEKLEVRPDDSGRYISKN